MGFTLVCDVDHIQLFRLVRLKATIFLVPAEIRLLHDLRFFARLCCGLPVRHRYFDLSKQVYYLL